MRAGCTCAVMPRLSAERVAIGLLFILRTTALGPTVVIFVTAHQSPSYCEEQISRCSAVLSQGGGRTANASWSTAPRAPYALSRQRCGLRGGPEVAPQTCSLSLPWNRANDCVYSDCDTRRDEAARRRAAEVANLMMAAAALRDNLGDKCPNGQPGAVTWRSLANGASRFCGCH